MREFLTFEELQKEQSASGAVRDKWVEVYSCRAQLMKTLPVYDKQGVSAHELFQGVRRIFKVRNHPAIKENQRVKHNGELFDIILTQTNIDDNSITIQVGRKNE